MKTQKNRILILLNFQYLTFFLISALIIFMLIKNQLNFFVPNKQNDFNRDNHQRIYFTNQKLIFKLQTIATNSEINLQTKKFLIIHQRQVNM